MRAWLRVYGRMGPSAGKPDRWHAPGEADAQVRTPARRAPLPPLARCCRTLDDGSNRVRLLCYDLARFRAYMEPALLAALACSWPSPLLTEGWEPDPNDDDVNGTPSFGNGTVGGSICDEHGGGRVLDEAVSPLPAELLPAAALAPAFARPGGATLAVLDLRCQRLLASTRIGLERSLHERACALLAQHGGRGWSLPLPAAVAQPPNVATATATPVHDVASPAATAATAATGSASALRQNSSAIAISATSTAHSDAARELKLIAQFLRGALPTSTCKCQHLGGPPVSQKVLGRAAQLAVLAARPKPSAKSIQ